MRKKRGVMSGYWRAWKRPSTVALGLVAMFFFIAGIVYMRTFDFAMAVTGEEAFCIGCHEMKDNVYPPYTESIHYSNRSGVRATCSACHVPHKWSDKVIRKVQASKEVFGKITGKIDTREKFLEHRLQLAQREWKRFRKNNSLECRNCHDESFFNFDMQGKPGTWMHTEMLEKGNFTCIDCHKGIAHDLPEIENLDLISPDTIEPTMRAPFDHAKTTLE